MFMCTYLSFLRVSIMSDFSTSVSAVQLQFDDSDSEKMALNVENMLRL